jgi:hypothetical protein
VLIESNAVKYPIIIPEGCALEFHRFLNRLVRYKLRSCVLTALQNFGRRMESRRGPVVVVRTK